MGRKKSEGELKSHQQHLLMAPSEIEAIDNWAFKNRIRSRGEAIRRLCQIGILFETKSDSLLAMLLLTAREGNNALESLAKQQSDPEELASTFQKTVSKVIEIGVQLSEASVPASLLRGGEEDFASAFEKAQEAAIDFRKRIREQDERLKASGSPIDAFGRQR